MATRGQYKRTLATLQKMSNSLKGRQFSDEHKKHISEGRFGENNPNWKNGISLYDNIHEWLGKTYGKATYCENNECNKICKRFEYALKIGYQHERNINNYIRLCTKCHSKYDRMAKQKPLLKWQISNHKKI